MMEIKRVYDAAQTGDGLRILVDRLWPRGLSKEAARIDIWMKEVAPSPALRKWFGHDPERWEEFKRSYFLELDASKEAVKELEELIGIGSPITLVYAAADPLHNNAVALRQYLEFRASSP